MSAGCAILVSMAGGAGLGDGDLIEPWCNKMHTRRIPVPAVTAKTANGGQILAQFGTYGLSTFFPFESTSIPHFGQIHPPSRNSLQVFFGLNQGSGVPQPGQSQRLRDISNK